MDLIEWVLVAAIKCSAGASQQISHAQTDDDRHQRYNELETAHEILRVLHGELSLIGTEPENRVTNGERRLPVCHRTDSSWRTCRSRQLAETGQVRVI